MNSKQIEQYEKADALATEIRQILCKIFYCNDNSIWCASVNSHPYFAMTQGLAFLSALHNRERVLYMERFVHKFFCYGEFSMDDFVSWESDEVKISDSKTIKLDKENGFEFMKYMIAEFKEIVGVVIDL